MSDSVHKTEAVAPVVGFVKRAGDHSGKTADYDAYIRDLEDRRNRPVHYRPAKQEINLVVELDSELSALEAGATDFEKSYGQPNTELIESRKIVAELTARLAEEQAK